VATLASEERRFVITRNRWWLTQRHRPDSARRARANITWRSVRRLSDEIINLSGHARGFGARRGITSWLVCGPVTLGYPESDHQYPEVGVPGCPVSVGQASQGALARPTETPQVRDTAADPHRNPTDETAHSGTLVMRVKGTEIPANQQAGRCGDPGRHRGPLHHQPRWACAGAGDGGRGTWSEGNMRQARHVASAACVIGRWTMVLELVLSLEPSAVGVLTDR
jgi:hypothetical protein